MDRHHDEQEASLLYASLTEEQRVTCTLLSDKCKRLRCPWQGKERHYDWVQELFPDNRCPRQGQGCQASPEDWAVYLTKAIEGAYIHE